VIELLPSLRRRFPGLLYLIVGGPSPEGDIGARLREQVTALGLQEAVRFLGPLPPEALHEPLSAADVFVLASSNEGWANVLLEAMACGLPVVATDVGGNREVVATRRLGIVVPFGQPPALEAALAASLTTDWHRDAIVDYARGNDWSRRVEVLREHIAQVARASSA
jgi:glycosyltransferase involved in cell wall biosynthesis